MGRLKKIIFCFALFIFMSNSVNALVFSYDTPPKNICYNATNPFVKAYSGNDELCWITGDEDEGHDIIKYDSNNNYAYCVNRRLSFSKKEYAVDNSWNKNSEKAIVAGYIVNSISGRFTDESEKYAMVGGTLNHYFNKYLSEPNAYRYDSLDSYVLAAKDYYNNVVKLDTKLTTINIVSDNKVLGVSGSNYVSSKVTVSGLADTYGGDPVSYSITASTAGGVNASLCTNSAGTDCRDSISIYNNSNTVNFYVVIDRSKLGANEKLTVKVSGSNKSIYPTSVLYYSTTDSSAQNMLVVDNLEVNRSINQSYDFEGPNLVKHTITGNKVNEYGESLDGAILEIYKDDYSDANNLLATNNGSGSTVTYVSPGSVESDDDFFKHDYYLVEKSSPDGYALTTSVNHFYRKNSTTSSESTLCYAKNGENPVDSEFCKYEDYDYMCQASNGNISSLDSNGNCSLVSESVVSESEADESGDESGDDVTINKVCYNNKNNEVVDNKYCNNKENYIKVTVLNGNLVVMQPNKKNIVRISKQGITGDEEISGASLKICTADSYNAKKDNCDVAKTIDDVPMSWVSGDSPQEYLGVPKGDYYIIELTPPNGYVRANIATSFSVDVAGNIRTGERTITNSDLINRIGAVVVKNGLNSVSISKQDMATSKELPGATISICRTYEDENGNIQILRDQYTNECIEEVLANGESASWVSTNEPKEIIGLKAGTYYLVEKIAPDGYATAESIQFTLKTDGTIVDKDGNSVSDSKIVMLDKPLEDLKTGSLDKYIAIIIVVLMVIFGVGSFYYIGKGNKKMSDSNTDSKKIRRRKIHNNK